MSKITKLTTGLTKLAVSQNPHKELTIIYGRILRNLAKMPSDAVYKQQTESLINQRLELVKNIPDISELESKINCGQIEEVIIQAENELSLTRKFLDWKPWEPLIEEAPKNQWKWPI